MKAVNVSWRGTTQVMHGHRALSLSTNHLLLLECIAATFVAFLLLSQQSMSLDESFSVALARLDWPDQLQVLTEKEGNMALYYLLLDVWLNLGDSEFAIRSLSAVFAVASVPAIYLLGNKLFGPRAGLLAGLLLLANGFWLRYAQEARSYSLVLLLVILASYAFVCVVERPTARRWAVFVVLAALAVYAHAFVLFVFATYGLFYLALLLLRGGPWKASLIAGGALVTLLLPFLAFSLTTGEGKQLFISEFDPRQIKSVVVGMAGGPVALLVEAIPLPGVGYHLPVIAYFVACAGTSLFALHMLAHHPGQGRIWRYFFVLAWFLVPIALASAVSLVRPTLTFRYFIVCLPALVLLASAGIAQVRDPRLFAGGAAALLLCSLSGVVNWYSSAEKEDWRGASSLVLSQARAGDAVVFFLPQTKFPFQYYKERHAGGADEPALEYYAGERGSDAEIFMIGYGELPPEADPELGRRLSQQYDRVWFVVNRGHDIARYEGLGRIQEATHASLQQAYEVVTRHVFGNPPDHKAIQIWLYERSAGRAVPAGS